MKISSPNYLSYCYFKESLVCFLMILQVNAFGQNYLMDDQESGFHMGVQISQNSFENYYALLPGYTFDGRLTLGLDVGKTKDMVNGINSTVLRPNVSYLILKQGEEGPPVSFDINAAYQFNYVDQVVFNSRSVQFGVGIFHQITPLEDVKIIPAVIVEGNKTTTGLNPRFDESVFMSYGAQVSIAWNNFYITPKFTSFDGVSTVGVKLGMILE